MIDYTDEVADARATNKPIVALESTIISHGLPWPDNLETAKRLEAEVRAMERRLERTRFGAGAS